MVSIHSEKRVNVSTQSPRPSPHNLKLSPNPSMGRRVVKVGNFFSRIFYFPKPQISRVFHSREEEEEEVMLKEGIKEEHMMKSTVEDESIKKKDEMLKQQRDLAQANEAKAEGNQLFVAGKFEEALTKYELAICFATPFEIPSSVELRSVCHSNRAVCFLKQYKYEKAIKECTKALELDAKNVKALIRRGEVAQKKIEHFDEAIADMNKILKLDPRNDKARKSIQVLESFKKDELLKQQRDLAQANDAKAEGNQLFMAGKFEDALSKYELALYFAPVGVPSSVELRSFCHSNRALCFLKQFKYEKAIKECTKALELNDKNVKALIRRGEAHEKLEHFDEAISDFEKTMELDPSKDQVRKSILLLEPLAAEKREKNMQEMQGSPKEMGKSSMESSSLIEVRNWEVLNPECLINIFGKVGLESLILDIPFVCKSWYKVSLDPHCYQVLDFQFMSLKRSPWAITVLQKKPYELRDESSPIAVTPSPQFMKIAVNRSCGLATEVVFHTCLLRDNILEYILERCPALKTLALPESKGYGILGREDYALKENDECLLKMIRKLPNLESLIFLNTYGRDGLNLKKVLNQIHIHCPNLVSLGVQDYIDRYTASDIGTFFPNIKHLLLRGSVVPLAHLSIILSGCRNLELLDVRRCVGIEEFDQGGEISTLTSHIKTVMVGTDNEQYVEYMTNMCI